MSKKEVSTSQPIQSEQQPKAISDAKALSATQSTKEEFSNKPKLTDSPVNTTSDDCQKGVLPGSISIKMKPVAVPVRPVVEKSVIQLTQERLQEAWRVLLEHCESTNAEMFDVLQGHSVTLSEGNCFVIVADNSIFERDLRLIQTSMLEYLRDKLSCPDLQCRVEIHAAQRENKVYHPSEKYEAMLLTNPFLEKFRVSFSELDY